MKKEKMGLCTLELALMCFIGIAMAHLTLAQPQEFLRLHNEARAQVGVGPMRWDNQVASYAQNYANKMSSTCNMIHSGGPYGENLAWGSDDLSVAGAVNMWVNERQFYDVGSNTCQGGECLHYTQVVWSNSVRLGCAKVRCSTGGTFITCNYDPPGNWIGQRPYSESM